MSGQQPERLRTAFPPAVLREYALVADGERGALVGPHGEVAWLCAPRWHDDAVLSGLVGGRGTYAVSPQRRSVWAGAYDPGTLVWRGRWVTDDGVVSCADALAMPADPHRVVLLRRVGADQGEARVRVLLDLRAHFGRAPMVEVTRAADGTWTGCTGGLRFRWRGGEEASIDGEGRLVLELRLDPGEQRDLVLEVSDRDLPAPEPVDRLWQSTSDTWRRAVPGLGGMVAERDARHALAVLRGLTTGSGGMVAAATLGLPERARASRNYDYRYVWVRDQCYAGLAAARAGGLAPLDDAVRFVTARVLEDGDRLVPAYLPDGGRVPDERTLDLPGYPGGRDVVGNWVNDQFQLDALGEVLQLLAAAARLDRLDPDGRRALATAVDVVQRRWTEPDAGIWELDPAWWTHSRLACIAGLRAVAEVAPYSLRQRADGLAGAVLDRTRRTCRHPSGRWQRSPQHAGVDAALLLPAVRGGLAPHDAAHLETLRAVRDDLTEDGYVYRFDPDDQPLGRAEGAFLLCGFVLALAEHQQGRRVEAFRWFERTRASCGPAGLLAEEYDVASRQLRGNLPQAFVHAMLLETAAVLTDG